MKRSVSKQAKHRKLPKNPEKPKLLAKLSKGRKLATPSKLPIQLQRLIHSEEKKFKAKKLRPHQLRQKTDIKQFIFKTTEEIDDLTEFVGQGRALGAVQFGIGIKSQGFNLYAMGQPGVGKHSVIRTILEREAETKVVPPDWCYVNNFKDTDKPIALKLPAGQGNVLRDDVDMLIEDLKTSIPIIFESEEYRQRYQKIMDEINEQQETLYKQILENAKAEGLMILTSPQGVSIVPIDEKGDVIKPEDFNKLQKEIKEQKEATIEAFGKGLTHFMNKHMRLNRERRKREKELRKEFAFVAVGSNVTHLKQKYEKYPKVVDYLESLQQDVIENFKDFVRHEEEQSSGSGSSAPIPTGIEKFSNTRYKVNVLIDNSKTKGVPVIYEDHPTYQNLICRVEHDVQFGVLMTDFTLIKAGSLHKANGGYLIIDALKLLNHPLTWEGLKRALFTRKIIIEPSERLMGLGASTISQNPMPIPLKIKIILIGDRSTYYFLSTLDPDFNELFKVAVDFEEIIDRNSVNLQLFAGLIGTLARREELRPFNRSAVAAIIDRSSRIAEDAEKLSIHMRSINDLIRESDYWASRSGNNVVSEEDVDAAVKAQIHRVDRIRERYYEEIIRDIVYIDTQDSRVGEINALSVIQYGNFSFGHPAKITAIVHFGKSGVIDIQREVKMGGPLHSKGVLILSGFLLGRYVKDEPFSLSATLVFEQTYGLVDGDSASVAELCVLLSAFANIPINQNIAVTGAINQHGLIQAIGGVNEKIEGFFDICKSRGLTGDQGVIIPKANTKHLMLREDVVAAAKANRFHIYPVEYIDEAIYILTGVPAGERGKNGEFPEGTVNYYVESCLYEFAKKRVMLARHPRFYKRKIPKLPQLAKQVIGAETIGSETIDADSSKPIKKRRISRIRKIKDSMKAKAKPKRKPRPKPKSKAQAKSISRLGFMKKRKASIAKTNKSKKKPSAKT